MTSFLDKLLLLKNIGGYTIRMHPINDKNVAKISLFPKFSFKNINPNKPTVMEDN